MGFFTTVISWVETHGGESLFRVVLAPTLGDVMLIAASVLSFLALITGKRKSFFFGAFVFSMFALFVLARAYQTVGSITAAGFLLSPILAGSALFYVIFQKRQRWYGFRILALAHIAISLFTVFPP